jgi:hypothetical protein
MAARMMKASMQMTTMTTRSAIARRRLLLSGALAAAGSALPARAGATLAIPRFSAAPVGSAVAPGWAHQRLPKVPEANRFEIVQDGSRRVLQVHSAAAASTWIARLSGDTPARPLLEWQWKVSRALAGSDLGSKDGDDYAARVYVLFDLPSERLSLGDRLRIAAARALSDAELPAAALCYVWGRAQPAGTSGWNPYTDRLRMFVVDSGDAFAQQWRSVRRDLRADWEAAFGGAMPPITAVAVGADTDNTADSVQAWFTDLVLAPAP